MRQVKACMGKSLQHRVEHCACRFNRDSLIRNSSQHDAMQHRWSQCQCTRISGAGLCLEQAAGAGCKRVRSVSLFHPTCVPPGVEARAVVVMLGPERSCTQHRYLVLGCPDRVDRLIDKLHSDGLQCGGDLRVPSQNHHGDSSRNNFGPHSCKRCAAG